MRLSTGKRGKNQLVVMFSYLSVVVFISFTVAVEVAERGWHESPGCLISPGAIYGGQGSLLPENHVHMRACISYIFIFLSDRSFHVPFSKILISHR